MAWTRPREIVIIRHAESLRNQIMAGGYVLPDEAARERLGDYYDHTIPLTERGWQQARASGPLLVAALGLPDCVYHSGYVRPMQTLQGLFEHLTPEQRSRIRIYEKIDLRERDPGYIWHMTRAEAERYFPWLNEYHHRVGKFQYRPPGGESLSDLACNRVHGVLGTIFRDRPGERVWLICHGHVMRALRFLMERIPLTEVDAIMREPIANVGMIRYTYDEESERPHRTHLNQVFWTE